MMRYARTIIGSSMHFGLFDRKDFHEVPAALPDSSLSNWLRQARPALRTYRCPRLP
jgi:hypothetical protein